MNSIIAGRLQRITNAAKEEMQQEKVMELKKAEAEKAVASVASKRVLQLKS